MAEQRRDLARAVERRCVVLRRHVYDAGPATVRLRTAEALHVDVLAGDAADHLRTGDEDATVTAHDHDVGQRRAVRRATGGRAEHDRDLRHPTRGPHHRREHDPDTVEGQHALRQPSAAGVPQTQHRYAFAHGHVDRVDDVAATLDAHGTAHLRAVGGVRDRRRTVDLALRAQHARAVALHRQTQRAPVEQVAQAKLGVAIVGGVVGGRGGRLGGGHGDPSGDGQACVKIRAAL